MVTKAIEYPVDQESIVQTYCIACRLLQGELRGREGTDCIECYSVLRSGMVDVATIERYKK